MQALGEHIILTIPRARLSTGGGIVLPENTSSQYWYGRVDSFGQKAFEYFSPVDQEGFRWEMIPNIYILFDKDGSVPVPIDPTKTSSVAVVIHMTQVYAQLSESELLERGLPLVEDNVQNGTVPVPSVS